MWYGPDDFLRDFHELVWLRCPDLVAADVRYREIGAFRKARVGRLVFPDHDAMPREEAQRLFWDAWTRLLRRERRRVLPAAIDHRVLDASAELTVEAFLARLFARLTRADRD